MFRPTTAAPLLAAVILLAVGAIAGCGGADQQVRVSPADLRPSKLDYILKADGLCAFYQDQIESRARRQFGISAEDLQIKPGGGFVFKPGRRPSDAQIRGFVAEVAVPELRKQVDELRALIRPEGPEAELGRIFDGAEVPIGRLADEPGIALDPAAVAALFRPPSRQARAFGFRVCGFTPSALPDAAS